MCTTKRLLAVERQFGCVTGCDCGTLHLTVGVVSLALDHQALRRVHRLLGAALEQLPELAPDPADEPAQAVGQAVPSAYLH